MTEKCEYVGIDVSKAMLDVACYKSQSFQQFKNTPRAIRTGQCALCLVYGRLVSFKT